MKKYLSMSAVVVSLFANSAFAALVVDTGAPINSGFPNMVSTAQFIASQVNFSQNLTLNSIQAYLNTDGANTGDSFTITLYSDNSNKVGSLINSSSGTYIADGWNGASALNWNIASGTYWVAIEESTDGVNFAAPNGVTNPLARSAFFDGAAYQASTLQFGLQIDATAVAAVPETDTYALLLAGLGIMGAVVRRRHA